ncbi:MAG: HEAT repeat domain-containing protein [Anaerolineae bacterium]
MLNGMTMAGALTGLHDADAAVRAQAAWALQYIGDGSVVDALLLTIRDAEMAVRVAAAQALG